MSKSHTLVHFEIPVDDLERAKTFYESVFNWKIKAANPDFPDYYMVYTVPVDDDNMLTEQGVNGGMMKRENPGSQMIKKQAEDLGLDKIFLDANFEWREAGCSMCLGMNPDILYPGERCASTSNRHFEGRQGAGGRTHLVSPVMAAAAAIEGHFVDVRKWDLN